MSKTNLNTEITDFSWVIKVLQSSETQTHISASDKLFLLFVEKWGIKETTKFHRFSNMYDRFRFTTKHKIKDVI